MARIDPVRRLLLYRYRRVTVAFESHGSLGNAGEWTETWNIVSITFQLKRDNGQLRACGLGINYMNDNNYGR